MNALHKPVTPLPLRPMQVELAAAPSPQVQAQLQDHLKHTHELRPGLHVHADDMVDGADFTARGEIEQGLRIVMLLEGSVDLSYGGHRLSLSSAAAGERQRRGPAGHSARAMLVSIAEAERFERHARQGRYARRLSIGMSGPWLAQMLDAGAPRPVDDFAHAHLAVQNWQPSARAVAMAEQLIRTPALSRPFLNLYMESRVLELVGEALASVGAAAHAPAPAPAPSGVPLLPHEHRRIRALHAFLQTEQAFGLSLDELAREAGTNPNTLQKHFLAVYGTTVFDFLREQRLQRAREALERDGVNVAQAALLAGYSSAANFATAFRKRFGMPPKLARHRF